MRTKLFSAVAAAMLAISALPAIAAGPPAEDETPTDARMEGFARDAGGGASSLAITPPSSTAGTWMMCIALGVLTFGAMAKNSKRTHLD